MTLALDGEVDLDDVLDELARTDPQVATCIDCGEETTTRVSTATATCRDCLPFGLSQ